MLTLAGVGGGGDRQAEPEELPEEDGGANGVGSAMEVTKAVKPFERQGQTSQQPDDE